MNLKHGDERLKERCVFDRFCFKISLYLEKKNKLFFFFLLQIMLTKDCTGLMLSFTRLDP